MSETINIKRRNGETFPAELLPLRNGKSAYCRNCQAEIRFVKTERGTMMPISMLENGDNVSHNTVCLNPDEKKGFDPKNS